MKVLVAGKGFIDSERHPIHYSSTITKQCAWCRRVRLPNGEWEAQPREEIIRNASHGICEPCAQKFRAERNKLK
jgi:hypothetical protein